MELDKKYRPKLFKHLVGQPKAVSTIRSWKSIPHAILLTGPSGTGKTTIARILRKKIGCGNKDYHELNCASVRGIDMVRQIQQRMNLAPISGRSRLWVIDEAHQLTSDAQDAFLKPLEEPPNHAYFVLCSTDPQKLKATIKTRVTEIKTVSVELPELEALITKVANAEEVELSEAVTEAIAEAADGSPRKALVILQQVMSFEDETEQLEAVTKANTKTEAIEIARRLINPKTKWPEMAKVLKEVEGEPESLRYLILSYVSSVILGGGKLAPRAFLLLEAFRDNFYDSKKAGLIAACWEVLNTSN